jgi:hypothetical protein
MLGLDEGCQSAAVDELHFRQVYLDALPGPADQGFELCDELSPVGEIDVASNTGLQPTVGIGYNRPFVHDNPPEEETSSAQSVPSSPRPCSLQLQLEIGDLLLEHEDLPNAGEGHALAGHVGDTLHRTDFGAAVAPLVALRSRWLHDRFGVEAAKERRLDAEHVSHLTDRVQRSVFIVER